MTARLAARRPRTLIDILPETAARHPEAAAIDALWQARLDSAKLSAR